MKKSDHLQTYARFVAISMSILGLVGILFDCLLQHLWTSGTPCWGTYEWIDIQYHVSVGLSVFLILLSLLLCVLWLIMGRGHVPMVMVRYISACVVLLGAQSGLHMLAMNGAVPGIVSELGYLAVMIAPVVFHKNKDRITGEDRSL